MVKWPPRGGTLDWHTQVRKRVDWSTKDRKSVLQTKPWLTRHAMSYILFLFDLRCINWGRGRGTISKWVPHHVYDQVMRTQVLLMRLGCSIYVPIQFQDCSSSIIINWVAHEDIIMIGIVQVHMIKHQEMLDLIVQ